jgi:hypothetical protein
MEEVYRSAGSTFSENVLNTILACLVGFRARLKSGHANSGFDPFGPYLRVMLTGGGSRADFYRKLVQEGLLEAALTRYTRWEADPDKRKSMSQGLLAEPLPTPHDLQNLPAALKPDFDRFSVAYGLAFGCRNLMRVICPEQPTHNLPHPTAPAQTKKTSYGHSNSASFASTLLVAS